MPPHVKVCVLGSTGVGKTKLVQQFVYNYYDDQYEPTMPNGNIVHCSTMINGNLYQMRIVDMPAIKEFPANNTVEWQQYRQSLLRNAHAYIFVFDLNMPVTFHYVKSLRDQLFESRNMQNVPVWIVGNKADLCLNVLATMRTHRHDHHHHHHHHTHPHPQHHPGDHRHHHRPLLLHSAAQHQIISPYEDLTPACKEFANLVRKQWKCNYIECSAKYNWRVVTIFREIIKSLDPILSALAESSASSAGQTTTTAASASASAMTTSAKEIVVHSSTKAAIGTGGAGSGAGTVATTGGTADTFSIRGLSPTEPSQSQSGNHSTNHSNRICRIS